MKKGNFFRKEDSVDISSGKRDLSDVISVKNGLTGTSPGKKDSAQISVFFALTTAMILALFLGVLESARTQGTRLSMTIAVNSAVDSLFSQYHKELWSDYRLLGLEQYAYDQLEEEMADFLSPYLEAKNWSLAKLDGIELSSVIHFAGENGEIFEEDVLDYMKFGIVAEVWEDLKEEFFDPKVEEGDALDEVSDIYDDHSLEAIDIEKTIGEIADKVLSSENKVSNALSRLEAGVSSGRAFINGLESAIKDLNKIPSLVDEYKKKAIKLDGELEKSQQELDLKKGEISDEVWASLNDDIAKYKEYVDEDGTRRREIVNLDERARKNVSVLEDVISETEAILESLKEMESGEEGEEEPIDPWGPIREMMDGYDHLEMEFESGVKDEETEGILESLKTMFSRPDLLSLVLPEGQEPSDEEKEFTDAPSEIWMEDPKAKRLGAIDKAYMTKYISSFFNYFGRGVNDDENIKGTGGCELEYILYGSANKDIKTSDRENLSAVVKRLVTLRSGLNLAFLYTNSEKRGEARDLALKIAGLVGFAPTPLVIVIQFLILSVWAMGQAVMDVRHLLKGEEVPFMHDSESFNLTLSGLLRINDENSVKEEDGGAKGKGDRFDLSYQQYLEILLFFEYQAQIEYRAMDMIELSLRKKQSDFKVERLVYSLEATANITASHLFSELGLTLGFGSIDKNYEISIPTSYSY